LPVTVYHGSRADFDTFDSEKLGSYTGAPSAKKGFFFASDYDASAHYAGDFRGETPFFAQHKELTKEVNKFCKKNNIQNGFELGYIAGSLFAKWPKVSKDASRGEIKQGLIENIKASAIKLKDHGEQFVQNVESGKEDISDWDPDTMEKIKAQLSIVDKSAKMISKFIRNYTGELTVRDIVGYVKEYNLKMEKPYIEDHEGDRLGRSFSTIIDYALANGHDGVIIKNTKDPRPTDVYIVFNADQIREVQ